MIRVMELSGESDVIGMTDSPEMYCAGVYNGGNVWPPTTGDTSRSTVSGSYKDGGGVTGSGTTSRRRGTVKPSMDPTDLAETCSSVDENSKYSPSMS
ncbi:hypothetical protein L1987_81058 [Smallanthus sonchifolius]|uniref:Uncharacterized protein n=1 Tax=Smallanthus sonchifolius TaxID=185202 RepID=A0ACB8YQG5_9ASTR|nr:hypothetical protein L1987_81058 [Smallanthus sonchifolius]